MLLPVILAIGFVGAMFCMAYIMMALIASFSMSIENRDTDAADKQWLAVANKYLCVGTVMLICTGTALFYFHFI